MDKYVRLNKTLNGKGLLVPIQVVEDEKELQKHLSKDEQSDWYSSLYYYGTEAKTHYDNNDNSIAGYKGPAFSNKLVFDFDSESIEEARVDAIELLRTLSKEGVNVDDSSRIFFSGNKGFHIEIPINKELTPIELKTICTNLANGLKTFDPVVYNTTRLFRLANTKHQETGLYKVELEPVELQNLTIQDIKTKALTKRFLDFTPKVVTNLTFLTKFNIKPTKTKTINVIDDIDSNGIRGITDIDFESCPRNKPRCIHALERGIMVPGNGERSALYLRLAAYYRNQGMTKDGVLGNLVAISQLNSELYPDSETFSREELRSTALNSVFSNNGSWKTVAGAHGTDSENPLLKKYCDAIDKHTSQKCCLHAETTTDKTTIQISEVFDSFNTFAENLDKNIVKTGINFIDSNMKIVTGTTSLLVGAAGCHRKGERVLRYSMEEVAVENVKVGDKLLGPNSEPRMVLHLVRGSEEMYEVSFPDYFNIKNKYFNAGHTLHIYDQKKAKIVQITIRDYLTSYTEEDQAHTHFLQVLTGVRSGIQNIPFSIRKVSDNEDYYGFTVSDDNLYLDDDYLIIKNCGKTTLSLNILEKAGELDQQNIFFSLDMAKNLVYLKLAQKVTNYKQDEIFRFHRDGDKKKVLEIKDKISEKYKLTLFDFSSTLTFDQMRDKVFEAEQKSGNKMKLVLVDYASRISGPYSDSYANANYNALKSREISDVTDSAWVILSQISRGTGDGCNPIRTKRAAKDSGSWEEAATNVMTVWRPFMGDPERDDVLRMFMAKNRMGAELEQVLHWDGAKGLVRDLTSDELSDYNALRGDKAEREYLRSKAGKTFGNDN